VGVLHGHFLSRAYGKHEFIDDFPVKPPFLLEIPQLAKVDCMPEGMGSTVSYPGEDHSMMNIIPYNSGFSSFFIPR